MAGRWLYHAGEPSKIFRNFIDGTIDATRRLRNLSELFCRAGMSLAKGRSGNVLACGGPLAIIRRFRFLPLTVMKTPLLFPPLAPLARAMNKPLAPILGLALLLLPAATHAADPVVSNPTAAQRAETKLVDITYDMTADTPTVIVSLEISSDGGTTFSVPATTVSGAIGAGVAIGTGKIITWDAGADWLGQYSTQMRFKVTANDVPPGFALIPAGPFQMGDALDGMTDASVHTVNVSAFYMQKKGVTKAEWDAVRAWGLTHDYTDLAAGAGEAADHPVQSVSWYDVVKWCNARSEQEAITPCYYTDAAQTAVFKTGSNNIDSTMVKWTANGYRLPTEAEREKASRGGQEGLRFPWGNTITHSQATYQSSALYSYDLSSTRGYHPTYGNNTAPVGSFAPNAYGLYDMASNVWDWCWDWYGSGYYASSPGTDPTGPSGSNRVIRGGYWGDYANNCRAAYRLYYSPDNTFFGTGFRPARSSVAEAGSGFAITVNVVVDTRAKVTLTTIAQHGTVTGGGDYTPDSIATLTATAAPGYGFTGWSGDASGTANPLNLVMDGPKSVTANFVPDTSDGDTDGLSAFDEAVVYGTDPALADTDGDGLSDGWEVGRGRFSIIAESFTWQQARADARSRGGDLASFPDEHRWNRAMETLGANALDDCTGLWLGASDAAVDGTWTWVNGDAFSFQQWAANRPSSTPGNTLDFAEVSGGAGSEIGKWYDRSPTTIRDGYLLETGYATDPKVADADGDGLNDSQEQTAGTNPFMADTDGDGLNDGQEVNLTHTNPKLADSDGDELNDAADDQDGDGLTNLAEITQHGTDPLKADTDADGVNDSAEITYAGSFFALVSGTFTYPQATADAAAKRGRIASFPNSADYSRMANKVRQTTQGYLWLGLSDAATEGTWVWTAGSTPTYNQWLTGEPSGGESENHAVIMENSTKWADTMETFVAAGYLFERVGLNPLDPDTDADGLTDGQEVNTTHSSPVLEDTDADGLTDGAEVNTHHSSPLLADTDSDDLNDRVEVEVYHSNPSLKDTDGDGFDDGFEVNTGFDPVLATSTPDAVSSIRTAVEFRFNAANGIGYRIEGSTDLNEWTTVETDITGTGGVVTRFYSVENKPTRYFRARRN
jgi:uncharacterized repeat protein (TIGR02543 family)